MSSTCQINTLSSKTKPCNNDEYKSLTVERESYTLCKEHYDKVMKYYGKKVVSDTPLKSNDSQPVSVIADNSWESADNVIPEHSFEPLEEHTSEHTSETFSAPAVSEHLNEMSTNVEELSGSSSGKKDKQHYVKPKAHFVICKKKGLKNDQKRLIEFDTYMESYFEMDKTPLAVILCEELVINMFESEFCTHFDAKKDIQLRLFYHSSTTGRFLVWNELWKDSIYREFLVKGMFGDGGCRKLFEERKVAEETRKAAEEARKAAEKARKAYQRSYSKKH